jgi:hypothetical protein
VLIDSYPNTGFYQWHIPNIMSNNCYLKLTLITPAETISTLTPRPFAIGMASNLSQKKEQKITFRKNNLSKKKIFDLLGKEVKPNFLKKGVYFIKDKNCQKLVITN